MIETKVIFRKWKNNGDVIAIFPQLPGNNNWSTCLSYENIGQHGTCGEALIIAHTQPANQSEYKALKNELESIGYNLKIGLRITDKDRKIRKTAINV